MRRTRLAATAVASLFGTALALPLTAPQVGAAPSPTPQAAEDGAVSLSDSLIRPWQKKYVARRQVALEQRLRQGGTGGTERLAKGEYARVEQSGTDRIFVVLAEFGGKEHSVFPDGASDAKRVNGPLHNQIPKPDRTVDNTTLWQRDFDRRHYKDMYFERMRRYYEHQSSGQYSVDGKVADWVKVPFNQARYGRNSCSTPEAPAVVCNNTWFLIRDALARWTKLKLDAGWTIGQLRAYLRDFDHQDRYDFDEDGDFAEPDGYIDHFQIVHAGGDEAAADPSYGEDAIWSHRWYAQINPFGTGPTGGGQFGGVNIGEGGVSDPTGSSVQIPNHPTGVWVGDYTIQPENGGLGVFTHEFGHDLGLPDLYDTSGNTGGAENSTGFWSLMSSGANAGRATDDGIGDHPVSLGAWEKFQLGWLDYETHRAGHNGTTVLRPNSSISDRARNGAVVLLPDKQVPLDLGAPCAACGERFYWSGSGDELNNTMTHAVDGGGPLTATVRYDIEEGWDYAFLESSGDGGETWTPVPTDQSYTGDDESGLNASGTGISGSSGGWVELTATVPAGTEAIRWRYTTDAAFALQGFQVDNITLAGETIGTAETGDEGWQLDGFSTTTGSELLPYLNAYFVDNRQYVRHDKTLKSVYNFGFTDSNLDLVEFFKYRPGALITYWDTSFADNNVGEHPGGGQILPVDAHPTFPHLPDGTLARPRVATADSTFSLRPSKAQTLHSLSQPFKIPAGDAVPTFDDTRDWWFTRADAEHGVPHDGDGDGEPDFFQPQWYGVDVPKTGTTITVVDVDDRGDMTIKVGTSN